MYINEVVSLFRLLTIDATVPIFQTFNNRFFAMSKLLVVIGIAGQQDGSVASLFSQEPGWKARGITRNQSSHSALAWTSKGVEMVQVDLNDPFSLPAAFSGATALFS